MKAQKLTLCVTAALTAAVCLPMAYAKWDNGGLNVTNFDSTNPNKIIFLDQVRPYESGLGRGTDRTDYTTQLNLSNTRKVRSPYPSTSLPEREYDPQRGGVDYRRLTSEGKVVWSHISKSAGVDCLVNETRCGQPGQVSSSSSCTYAKVKTTISGEVTAGVEYAAKVNNVDTTSGASATGTFIREWESGWEACQSEGTSHSCPPDQNLTFNAVNFATTEARSRFGWHKFSTTGRTFYFNDRYRDADVRFCETTIGGNYITGGFLIEPKKGRCEVFTGKAVPSFERYERMPLPNSDTNAPIAPTCRTLKKV